MENMHGPATCRQTIRALCEVPGAAVFMLRLISITNHSKHGVSLSFFFIFLQAIVAIDIYRHGYTHHRAAGQHEKKQHHTLSPYIINIYR